jgi:hypothetical protein
MGIAEKSGKILLDGKTLLQQIKVKSKPSEYTDFEIHLELFCLENDFILCNVA